MSFEFLPSSVFPATPLAVSLGGTGSASAADARTALGLEIDTDVQAYSAKLAAIAGLAVTDGNIIVGDGATFVAESGATARTSLGLGTIATQAANAVAITGGTITGVTQIDVLEHVAPTEAATVNATAGTNTLILEPASALTDLTVNLPGTPTNGQRFTVAASGDGITNLTLGAGAGTIAGAITTLAEDAFASYIYRTANTTWYRCG